MSLRVLLITEYFWPDEAGTGRYLGDLLLELSRQEAPLEFEVLTSRRLYRSSAPRDLPLRETVESIRVRRIGSLRRGQDRFARRLLADLVFSLRAAWATMTTGADCLFVVTNPPLMPMFVAPLARWRGLPLVYLIHDLYPDVPVALGVWSRRSRFVRLLRRAQTRTLESACTVVVLGRCMKAYLARWYGVAEADIEFIPHWPTLVADPSNGETTSQSGDTFRVLYSGNLGRFQDFETLLDAAEHLGAESHVEFRILGQGARQGDLRREIDRRKLTNVTLEDFRDEGAFREELRHAHLGVVTLEPQLEGIGVPSKTYNLLAADLPLCAIMGPSSEVARIIDEYRCGIRVGHGESDALAAAILELQRDEGRWQEMSGAARRYVDENAALPVLAARYRRVLEACADRPPTGSTWR